MKVRSHLIEALVPWLAVCAGCGSGPETLVQATTEDGKTVYESTVKYDGSRRELKFEHEGKTYFLLLQSKDSTSPATGKDKREWHLELYRDAIGKDAALTTLIETDPASSGGLGGCGMSFDDRDSRLRIYLGYTGSMMDARKACERVAASSRPR